jgi:hypothetical protein
MATKNVTTKKKARSAVKPAKAAVKKPRKAKPTERAAHAGLKLATRSFELAKGSLVTLLRELKEERMQQLEAGIGS